MNNKKGVSAIVATVLIILITVAAVTIIWAAIIPMVSNQLDRGNACLDATTQLQIGGSGYTCWNSSDNNLSIQVKAGAQIDNLANLQFLIGEAGLMVGVKLINATGEVSPGITGDTSVPEANRDYIYIIRTSAFSGVNTPDTVGIAPMILLGNSVETCDVASTLSPIPICI